jgi:hypothetical protein
MCFFIPSPSILPAPGRPANPAFVPQSSRFPAGDCAPTDTKPIDVIINCFRMRQVEVFQQIRSNCHIILHCRELFRAVLAAIAKVPPVRMPKNTPAPWVNSLRAESAKFPSAPRMVFVSCSVSSANGIVPYAGMEISDNFILENSFCSKMVK